MSVVFNAEGPFDSVSALRTGTSTPLCCAQDDRGPFDGAQDRLACWGRGKIIGPGKENEETLSVPLPDFVDFRTLW